MEKIKNFCKDWKNVCITLLAIVTVVASFSACYLFFKWYRYSNTTTARGYVSIDESVDGTVADSGAETYEQNILERFAMPELGRMDQEDQDTLVNNLQVLQKMRSLGVNLDQVLYPENNLAGIKAEIKASQDWIEFANREVVDFTGTTSKELQKCIEANQGKSISIKSETIEVSSEINLPESTFIYGNGARFVGDSKYLFVAVRTNNILIDNIVADGGFGFGVYLVDCGNAYVLNSKFTGMNDKAICVVNGCYNIGIENNYIADNGQGGIYAVGNCGNLYIKGNTINNSLGGGNYMAGIVLCSVLTNDEMNIWDPYPDNHWWPYKNAVKDDLWSPHRFVIEDNSIRDNLSSGIYMDGAYLGCIVNNVIEGNDKEGMCLDDGTFGCYVAENIVKDNGRRAKKSDEELQLDYILGAGRMADGSANSKVPGISLDNAAYNMLMYNTVADNAGGGIKAVRTAVRNIIFGNTLSDNNAGAGDVFHFFAIELGSARSDAPSSDLDFTPCYENIIARNTISGNHYSGVFIAEDGYINDVFDNVIMDCEFFCIECISTKFNSFMNNFSNKDIRNEFIPE